MTSSSGTWWADWPKFLPGWLAFIATVFTLIRSWWIRRSHLALGPDDDAAREALVAARRLFEDITSAGGQRVYWWTKEDRRETFRTVRDLAERRGDSRLKAAMLGVADAGDEAFASAPPNRARLTWVGQEPSPHDRTEAAADAQQSQKQVDSASNGLRLVEEALSRLNDLERRTTGH